MLTIQKIEQLMAHGYPVFRLKRSVRLTYLDTGVPGFRSAYGDRDIPVTEHFRPWLFQVDWTDSDWLLAGPEFNLIHRYTWLVKFPHVAVLVGLLEGSGAAEQATEKAIDFLLQRGARPEHCTAELVI